MPGPDGGAVRLLLATRSAHKVAEIRRILADVPGLETLDLDQAGIPWSPEEEALEPFDTFEANARSKARHFRRRSGLATVADDSGIEVDALGGDPGVRSRRFAPVSGDVSRDRQDRANNEYLVALLEGVEPSRRTARYVCVAALDRGEEDVVTFRGTAEGRILERPRGDGGFGYDPLFLDPELGRSFAEIPADAKHERSHRGEAFRALATHLKDRR